MNIGNGSLWSWIIIPILAICVMSPDSMGLLSITSTCHFSFRSWSGMWWWWANSWSINAMPVAPQSIRAFGGISWLCTVNVQGITKYFPAIDPSDTSTFLTDQCQIPIHFKGSKTQLLLSIEEPSFFNWLALFPIPRNRSRFLLPLLLLQPPWTSEPSSLLHTPPPCGQTPHSTNISHR